MKPDHAKIRPPRSAIVIAAFDLDTWGDTDDGKPHHAFLYAVKSDETSATAYVAPCSCSGMPPDCCRTKVMLAGRAFFDSLTIIERAVPKARPQRRRMAGR